MSDRQEWADLIRNEYDPAPSHYRIGDNWDDGAERIADAILADQTLLMRRHADEIEKLRKENEELRAADRDHLAAKNGMEKRLSDEIERLTKQLVTVSRKAIDMRNAINDVELALAGLEIDDMVDAWEGAMNTTKLKVSLGALRQLRNSYPALNRIMNEAEYNPDQFTQTDEKGDVLAEGHVPVSTAGDILP